MPNTRSPRAYLVMFFVALCILPLILMSLAARAVVQTASSPNSNVSNYATGPHIEVTLLSNKTALVPGQSLELAVLFEPEQDWHTYWRNPGDSGEAPTIVWQENEVLDFGEIQWPLPTAIRIAHLVNYGYEGSNLLIVPVNVPDSIEQVTVTEQQEMRITADISWLVCKEDCIPGWATLSLTLPIAKTANPSEHAALFEQTRQQWPASEVKPGVFEVNDDAVVFEVRDVTQQQWQVFPFRSDVISHAAQQTIVQDESITRVMVPRSDYFDGQADSLSWLISNGSQGYYVNGTANQTTALEASSSRMPFSQLALFLVMAFAGGLILNLMPCVLPILSIKAMALHNTQVAVTHKFAYFFGVMFCFNLFAFVIVLLQQSGQQVGWGFHMQEPVIIVLLAFLFTLIALVLLDTLAVSSKLSNIGNGLVSGETASAHFATGALAVIVASPCTAPFMAAALGVALVSSPLVAFMLFNALAIGFALPLTLLFLSRRALNWLPKPGAWMETFKHLLAFPMFATVAWLCWVFTGQMGGQAQFVLLIALILFAMFIYLFARSSQNLSKIINGAGIIISLVLPIWISVAGHGTGSKGNMASVGALQHIPFSQQKLQQLRDSDQVVVINMTADWCITCKVNEQVAFSSDELRQALQQEKVNYMVGDWTNKNDEILQYLTQYERAGVPLYVVYAGNKQQQVLPQILTPNTVINAINNAKEELQHVN